MFPKENKKPGLPRLDKGKANSDSLKKKDIMKQIRWLANKPDKKAIASLIKLNSGKVRLSFYQRDANSFASLIKRNYLRTHKPFKSLTVDNGKENNKLDKEFAKDKIYNYHAYCSWEKGFVENLHRLIRRIIPKGQSLNAYTDLDLQQAENFINAYYRLRYQNV